MPYGKGIYIYEMILYAERTYFALYSHSSRQNRSSVRNGTIPTLSRAVTLNTILINIIFKLNTDWFLSFQQEMQFYRDRGREHM